MNYNEVLDTLKEEMEILIEEEKKPGSPLRNGSEPSCETGAGTARTGSEPSCCTSDDDKKPAVKAAEMPEVTAMVLSVLKKNKVETASAIKLARPISSTILAFERKNSKKDLNDFDAELYSKLCSDFEKISALKSNADKLAQKIVDGYHNC
jgi:hypothetical protein